jgi:excisionase family DNA binding protein
MRKQQSSADSVAPAFYSVAATARMLGASEMTVYRAIQDGEFPALRIRGRIVVPARALEAMTEAAVHSATSTVRCPATAAVAEEAADGRG